MLLRRVSSLCLLRTARRTCSSLTEAGDPAVPKVQKVPENFRTLETDPENHTLEHEGKFYNIADEARESLFKYGGLPSAFVDQMKVVDNLSFMVRRPALEVIHYLKTADYSLPPIRYILHSQYVGAGMTLTLATLIHYAWLRKWLIVHCPDPYSWVRTCRNKTMQLSTYKPTRLDQNREASMWLQHFKQQNEHLTEEIKLSDTYTWSKREVSEKGQSLLSVVNHGLNRLPHAADCVAVVLKEIKAQSGPNSFRTLVVIDGVNALFGDVTYIRPDKSRISVDDLTLVWAFKNLLSNDWSNGAVVTTVDPTVNCFLPKPKEKPLKVLWPDRNPHTHKLVDTTVPIVKKELSYPKELLGPAGFMLMEPFVPVDVVKYSLKEFNSCYSYYLHHNYITGAAGQSEEGREELLFLSGRIPLDLNRYCASL